jgi:hypothetical protein
MKKDVFVLATVGRLGHAAVSPYPRGSSHAKAPICTYSNHSSSGSSSPGTAPAARTLSKRGFSQLGPLHVAIPELALIDPAGAPNGGTVVHVQFGHSAP